MRQQGPYLLGRILGRVKRGVKRDGYLTLPRPFNRLRTQHLGAAFSHLLQQRVVELGHVTSR